MNFICRAFCLTALLFASHTALAGEETYLREYTYQASEADSKITARAIALQEVKRILLSELGTHVSSLVKLQADASGKRLGTEQIETLSAGVTRVEILAEKWDGSTYVLKAQIKADPADVLRSLQKMLDADAKQKQVSQLGGELDKMRGENMQMGEQLAQSRKAADAAMAEIAHLKQRLKLQQTDAQRQALQSQYQQQSQQIALQELFAAGMQKYHAGDLSTALALWLKASEQGLAAAQNNLGVMYGTGQGTPQNLKQAAYWTRKAAEQGLAQSQFNLGVAHNNGRGVTQDASLAAYWYRQAAEQNLAAAQFNLGVMYAEGVGVHQDFNQAVYWYRLAAEQGDADAQNNLGMMYSKGEGVLQDFQQALYWFHKAAEQGKAGKYNIGVMYDKGAGVPQDFKQAVYWYRQAAEQNHISAQGNLGVMYAKGEGVPQDFMQAIYWYSKAAEQGDASAQYNLGMMYGKGQGVPQNYQTELTWIRKAAAQGHEKAIKFLPILQKLNP
jgi:hypothetical protein